MKLGVLFQNIPILDSIHWNPHLKIKKITSDSRNLDPGDVFVACPGSRMDGHDFIGQAIVAQASVIIYERKPDVRLPKSIVAIQVRDTQACFAELLNRFYDYPDKKIKLIGVTGTNGKTTVSYLLHQLLRQKVPSAYLGTLWYDLDGKKKKSALNTTPGAEVLIPLLANMVDAGIKYCVLEVSSHALEQRRVHGLQFELAIFTQLTQDHLDYHGSMERYFQSKRSFFTSYPRPKKMLINLDCNYGKKLFQDCPHASTFSMISQADFYAKDIQSTFRGSQFQVMHGKAVTDFQIRLALAHNVSNCVAVLSALSILGFKLKDFSALIREIPGIPGRMEAVTTKEPFEVFVDYAHTPDAVENVLKAARTLKPRRVLTLFGCGGDRDRAKRPLMAAAACRYSDVVVLTSDNPRSENPEQIIVDAKQGTKGDDSRAQHIHCVLDRKEAIETILALAEPGDALFILGKGHENYQIRGDEKIPFDDRLVIKNYLARKEPRVFLS